MFAVIKLWSGEADASGELSADGSFTAANFEPTAQMPVDELFSHIGESLLVQTTVHIGWISLLRAHRPDAGG